MVHMQNLLALSDRRLLPSLPVLGHAPLTVLKQHTGSLPVRFFKCHTSDRYASTLLIGPTQRDDRRKWALHQLLRRGFLFL